MRSKFWTFIYSANIFIVLHLVLVVVGETVRAASTGPVCDELQRTPCAYIAGAQETLSDVAARFGVTTEMLVILNPTVPLFWSMSPGTMIWIPKSRPADF